MKDWRRTPSLCFRAQTHEVREAFFSVWKKVLFRKIRGMSKTADLDIHSLVARWHKQCIIMTSRGSSCLIFPRQRRAPGSGFRDLGSLLPEPGLTAEGTSKRRES